MKGLWEGVLEQSTEQFTPIKSNYQQEIAHSKTELDKYHNNNRRWQKLFNAWQQETAVLANEKLIKAVGRKASKNRRAQSAVPTNINEPRTLL